MPRNKRSAELLEEEDLNATEQPQESKESGDDGVDDENEDVLSGQDEADGTDDDEDDEESVDEKEIQVDFEAYPTQESDFHGVKKLLGQLFLKAKIDLKNLTETIIAQSDTSFVIQQADGPEDEDDEEIDQEVYGISSIVNLSSKGVKSIEELRKFIVSKCNNVANVEKMREMLSNPEKHPVAWIVNERFINLSPRIALPCLQNLYSEVKKDPNKYPYEHFIFIVKLLKSNGPVSKRKIKKMKKSHKNNDGAANACQVSETIYQNAEEEILVDAADESLEWNVSEECDADARGGNWDEEDVKYTPWRKIVMLSRKSFQRSLGALEQELLCSSEASS